ncbi:MAG: c-type cytochrome [Campylobacteraceae bacterium]|jgi:cytochrome c553|nr:c-type cytochrome [Campylobacteraceae bacterium]
MRKLLIFLVLSCTCTLFAEEEITIKATGEFAKELKELMEKYQTADINGTVEIIDDNANQEPLITEDNETGDEIVIIDDVSHIEMQSEQKEEKGFSVMNMLFGKKDVSGNLTQGENLYKKECTVCHGERAEKSSYLSARDLITLPKDEIIEQLKSYKRDSGYGGTSGLIMRVRAIMLNDEHINDVASYIESLK